MCRAHWSSQSDVECCRCAGHTGAHSLMEETDAKGLLHKEAIKGNG